MLFKKIKMQDLKRWCRLCASDGIYKVDIFLKQIENNSSIADDLNKLFNLKLENKTELPTKICEQCKISIINLKQFLINSIKTQRLFFELLYNEINDCSKLRKNHKIEVDPEIKEKHIFTSLKSEYDLKETSFKNEVKAENEINMFDDKNSDVLEEGEEDLPLSQIKVKINKKRSKTMNLKKEKLHLENDNSKLKDISKTSELIKEKIVESNVKQRAKHKCRVCEKIFGNQAGLTNHMKIRHSIKRDPYSCKFCGKKFIKRPALENHENTHLPSEERKQLLCPHCDKKFTSESGRWTHIHSVHDNKKTVICEECGKKFPTKPYLDRHKLCHTEEKKYQCPYCPAKHKSKGRLTRHLHTHGELHPCLECGLQLKTKDLLKYHMIVHSDVKNFKCNFCNKDFKRIKDLKNHLIMHIGINPFECRICKETFSHNVTYRRHLIATHPKEFDEMVAKGERLSIRNVPSLEQLKAINEAAKTGKALHDLTKN